MPNRLLLALVALVLGGGLALLLFANDPASEPSAAPPAERAPGHEVVSAGPEAHATAPRVPATEVAAEAWAEIRVSVVAPQRRVNRRRAAQGDDSPAPLPAGCEVRLLADRGRGEVLATLPFEEFGSVVASVPWRDAVVDDKGQTSILAQLRGPGLAPSYARVWRQGKRVPSLGSGDADGIALRADLTPKPGASLEVRLVDEAGGLIEPAGDPSFVLSRGPGVSSPIQNVLRRSSSFDQPGSFDRAGGDAIYTLGLSKGDWPAWLCVDAGQCGLGALEITEAPDFGADAIDVTVRGAGRLDLRVVDSNGSPVRGLETVVTWSPEGQPSPSFIEDWGPPEPAHTDLLRAGEGRVLVEAQTDDQGRLQLDGLALREFHVFASRAMLDVYATEFELLGRAVAMPAPEPVELRYDRATLVVRLASVVPDDEVFARGARVQVFDAGPLGRKAWVRPDMWGGGLSVGSADREVLFLPGAASEREIDLPPNRHYCVALRAGERMTRPVIVAVGAAPSSTVLVVDPSELSSMARIVVDVRNGAAEEAPSDGSFGVWIEDLDTALPIVTWKDSASSDLPDSGFVVPSGPLRIVAQGLPSIEFWHGTVGEPRRFGRAEAIVDARPGEVESVVLRLDAGGTLELDVRGVLGTADEAALAAHLERLGDGAILEEEGEHIAARIELEDVSRNFLQPVVRLGPAMLNSSAAGTHVLDHWPLGETSISEVLPVGTYTLRATHVTRAPIERTVTIEEGKSTRVVIDFGG